MKENVRMIENVCVTCQYYESCNRPERFMKCMGYKRELQTGDTIQCDNIATDFLHEKDDVQEL
jgi:hypothetical protein